MPYLKRYFTISLLCTWQGAGISGIKVHRITRVHNRILRTRFDEKLDQILDQNDIADLTKYELIFNRLLICVVSILKWSILSLRAQRNEVSFADVLLGCHATLRLWGEHCVTSQKTVAMETNRNNLALANNSLELFLSHKLLPVNYLLKRHFHKLATTTTAICYQLM